MRNIHLKLKDYQYDQIAKMANNLGIPVTTYLKQLIYLASKNEGILNESIFQSKLDKTKILVENLNLYLMNKLDEFAYYPHSEIRGEKTKIIQDILDLIKKGEFK